MSILSIFSEDVETRGFDPALSIELLDTLMIVWFGSLPAAAGPGSAQENGSFTKWNWNWN